MSKGYEVYRFDDSGFGQAWIVSETLEEAVATYEDQVNHEAKDERYDAEYSGRVFKPDYTVEKLTEKEIGEVMILERCGGLWSNPATKNIQENIERGVKMPYVLCEKES